MKHIYEATFLEPVSEFISRLSITDQAKVAASITCLEEGDFETIHTKTLRGVIKELIVKRYRFIYIIKRNTIYFIGAFIKKSNKTPKAELNRAEQISKLIL